MGLFPWRSGIVGIPYLWGLEQSSTPYPDFAFQKVSLEWSGILKTSVTPDQGSSVGSSSSVGLALIFPLCDVQTPVSSDPL